MPKQNAKELENGYYLIYTAALPGVPEGINPGLHLLWREVDTIVRAIKQHRAKMTNVTAALGITRHALRRKLVKFGIPKLEVWRDQAADLALGPNLPRGTFTEERSPDPGMVVGADPGSAQPSTLIPPLPEPVPGPKLVGG